MTLSFKFPVISQVSKFQVHHMNLNSLRTTNHLLIEWNDLSSIRTTSPKIGIQNCSDQSPILLHRIITILIEMMYEDKHVNTVRCQHLKGAREEDIKQDILLCYYLPCEKKLKEKGLLNHCLFPLGSAECL